MVISSFWVYIISLFKLEQHVLLFSVFYVLKLRTIYFCCNEINCSWLVIIVYLLVCPFYKFYNFIWIYVDFFFFLFYHNQDVYSCTLYFLIWQSLFLYLIPYPIPVLAQPCSHWRMCHAPWLVGNRLDVWLSWRTIEITTKYLSAICMYLRLVMKSAALGYQDIEVKGIIGIERKSGTRKVEVYKGKIHTFKIRISHLCCIVQLQHQLKALISFKTFRNFIKICTT